VRQAPRPRAAGGRRGAAPARTAGGERGGGIVLERVDAAPDVHHPRDAVLDEFQRRQHLRDALAGKVLEIAGIEDADHLVADVLRERALLLALDRGRKRVGGLVEIFRRRKDLLDRALAT
jgi:hypothetical protein